MVFNQIYSNQRLKLRFFSSVVAKTKTVPFNCKENGIQVDVMDKNWFHCKSQINCKVLIDYQFSSIQSASYILFFLCLDPMSSRIPKSMFVLSPLEKSIVDIRVMEKTGQRNLPILQEEKTFRIFGTYSFMYPSNRDLISFFIFSENSELVKPIDTWVDNRKLSVETILPELALIERKTNSELDSEECILAFNKVIILHEIQINYQMITNFFLVV